MRSVRSVLIALVVMVTAGSATAAEVLVLDASPGLAFKKGDIVDSTSEISVPEGSRAVLMDGAGKTITLSGPYRGAPGGKAALGASMLHRLSALVTSGGGEGGTVIGAVRGISGPPWRNPGNPWLVNVSANGERCIQGTTATLWRFDTRAERTLVMRREPDSDWVKVSWPARQPTLSWPEALAREDGARYRVMLDGPLSTKFITVHLAPRAFENDAERLVWLYEAGCRDQADLLIEALAEKTGSR